jgi:Zn-dependent metalloprotease
MMNSRLVFCSLVLASISLAACGGQDAPPAFTTANDLESRLESDTGVAWAVVREAPTVGPRVLGPLRPVPLPGSSFEEKARGFFDRYGSALGPTAAHQLAIVEDRSDEDGSHETAFAETLPGTELPVFDSVSSVRFDANGNVTYVQSGLGSDIAKTPTTAKVSPAAALESARKHLESACGAAWTGAPTEVLGALPSAEGAASLVYRIDVAEATGTCAGPTVFVDASSGAVQEMREHATEIQDRSPGGSYHYWRNPNDIKTIEVSQNRDFSYELRSSQGPLVSTWYYGQDGRKYPVRMSQLGAWDTFDKGISVDAAYYGFKALEYFRAVHGRNGLDGRGSPLVVVTHDNSPFNSDGNNAHYQPWSGEIHVGDGTPKGGFLPLSLSFDVMTHELAHGIIAATSNLVYEGQSGALNESFADVMGIAAKYWLPEARATADMRIGRLATRTGEGIRDLVQPLLFGQPQVFVNDTPCGGSATRENDHCGVHRYSGIPNRAFSLMTLGGGEGDLVVKKGMGIEAARYVWFRAMTGLRNPRATFREAAYAQLFEAGALGPEAVASVGCAWAGVGVLKRSELDPWGNLCGTRPHYTGCNMVGNGYACHEGAPYAAYVCKNGSIAGGINCVDVGHTCRRRGQNDWAASVDAGGRLVCDPPPPPKKEE